MPTEIQWRPQYLDDLVGQQMLKQKARIAIQAALQRGTPLPHSLLLSPGGGLGKTTLAAVLANEMFVPFTATTGQCLATPVDLRNLLVRVEPNTVVLVDEFHGVGRLAAEELLLVLEEGVLNVNLNGTSAPLRIPVTPFTLCEATTQPEAVSAPLRQRFGLTFRFEFYAQRELEQIVSAIFTRWQLPIDAAAVSEVARRARGVPRIGLRLAERVRDVVQAQSASGVTVDSVRLAMQIEGIDDLGLTIEERQLLHVLHDAEPRPVSARSLALALGVGVSTVAEVLEPPLVRLGLRPIGPGGRRISERGVDHLRARQGERVSG